MILLPKSIRFKATNPNNHKNKQKTRNKIRCKSAISPQVPKRAQNPVLAPLCPPHRVTKQATKANLQPQSNRHRNQAKNKLRTQ